jgi:hypothetical protein
VIASNVPTVKSPLMARLMDGFDLAIYSALTLPSMATGFRHSLPE